MYYESQAGPEPERFQGLSVWEILPSRGPFTQMQKTVLHVLRLSIGISFLLSLLACFCAVCHPGHFLNKNTKNKILMLGLSVCLGECACQFLRRTLF